MIYDKIEFTMGAAETRPLPTIEAGGADEALLALDEVARLYMGGVRRVRRHILSVPDAPRVPQENVAEHSWSVNLAVRTLWENRRDLGLNFDEDFDAGLALAYADIHDIGETGQLMDVDAMTEDPEVLASKNGIEAATFTEIGRNSKYLGWLANFGLRALQKESPEFKFASDTDKHIGIRVVTLYAPWRWWGIGGEITTREKHDRIMKDKLKTPFGHAVYDAINRDFDRREELAASKNATSLFPPTVEHGEAVCASGIHKTMMGYRKRRIDQSTV